MEFKKLQEGVINNAKRYSKKHNIEFDEDFVTLKLCEEVGELVQASLIHRKKCRAEKFLPEQESKNKLAKEMADVLNMIIIMADSLAIDLEESMMEKCVKKGLDYKNDN